MTPLFKFQVVHCANLIENKLHDVFKRRYETVTCYLKTKRTLSIHALNNQLQQKQSQGITKLIFASDLAKRFG